MKDNLQSLSIADVGRKDAVSVLMVMASLIQSDAEGAEDSDECDEEGGD